MTSTQPSRPPSSVRRKPRQKRSQRRWDSIIESAATLFAQGGFEGTTMEAIAKNANTSIGSVYQFFANKEDLFETMTQELLAGVRELFHRFHPQRLPDDWRTLLFNVVDAFWMFFRADKRYAAILRNLPVFFRVHGHARPLQEEFVQRGAEVLRHYAPSIQRKRARAVAITVNQLVGSTIYYMALWAPERTEQAVNELKVVLERYVESEIDS